MTDEDTNLKYFWKGVPGQECIEASAISSGGFRGLTEPDLQLHQGSDNGPVVAKFRRSRESEGRLLEYSSSCVPDSLLRRCVLFVTLFIFKRAPGPDWSLPNLLVRVDGRVLSNGDPFSTHPRPRGR